MVSRRISSNTTRSFCYYNALPPADRFELMDPVFAMYTAMRDSCARAARQQWGSEGIWIPETVWFDGLETLPDDIADEMRELYLARKPWEERSDRFRVYAEPKPPTIRAGTGRTKGRGSKAGGSAATRVPVRSVR